MSEILVTRKHHLTAEEARVASVHVAKKLQKEYHLKYEWKSLNVLCFDRTGLQGELRLTKGKATIHLHLGFLLFAFSGTIEREIHLYFDENFS